MDDFHNQQLNYVYHVAQHIDENYEPEPWEGFMLGAAFHSYAWDHDADDFHDLRLVVRVERDGYEFAPHNLVDEVRKHGLELTRIAVKWEEGEASLIFHPLNR